MNNENQENVMTIAEEYTENSGEVLSISSSEACGSCCNPECNSGNEGWSENSCSCGGSCEECCGNCCSSTELNISTRSIMMKSGMDITLYVNVPVTWSSSNRSVALVNSCGKVLARRKGKAIITAKACDGRKATCVVIVDNRERVRIRQRDNYFYVHFRERPEGSANVWRSVEFDLFRENDVYYKSLWESGENKVRQARENLSFNMQQDFSPSQLALLFRLDPYGVMKYVYDYCLGGRVLSSDTYPDSDSVLRGLRFKDDVYCAIFGEEVRYGKNFYFKNIGGKAEYDKWENVPRLEKFSNAELLFGEHTYLDWNEIIRSIFVGVAELIFGEFDVASVDDILTAKQLIEILFFSESIKDAFAGSASVFLENFVENASKLELLKTLPIWIKIPLGLLNVIASAFLDGFRFPNPMIFYICQTLASNEEYVLELYANNASLTMNQIVESCNNLN